MEFSRQEYWSGLPFPSPGELPNPRIKPKSALWADSLPSEPQGSHEATRESANHINLTSLPSILLFASVAAVYTVYIALCIYLFFAGKCCMVNTFLYENHKNKLKNPPELYRDGKNSVKMSCVRNFIQHSLKPCLTA